MILFKEDRIMNTTSYIHLLKKVFVLLLIVATALSGVSFLPSKTEAAASYYYSKYTVDTDGWYLYDSPTISQALKGKVYRKGIGGFIDRDDSPEAYGITRSFYFSSTNSNFLNGIDQDGKFIYFPNEGDSGVKYTNNDFHYQNYYIDPTYEYTFKGPLQLEHTEVNARKMFSIYNLTLNPPKNRGTLVQSKISAIDGTYPNDGVHSDGFWYVKGEALPNNNPVISVTQAGDKTINLKSGSDSFVISGTISDIDTEEVLVSAVIGGVRKEVSVQANSAPKSWSLAWRTSEFPSSAPYSNISVTANDVSGQATDIYAGTLTVNKTPLFYWDKYTAKEFTVWEDVGDWQFSHSDKVGGQYGYRPTYSFDADGKYKIYGVYGNYIPAIGGSYNVTIPKDGKEYTTYEYLNLSQSEIRKLVMRWDVDGSGVYIDEYFVDVYVMSKPTGKVNMVRGDFVQANILDLDGTYPDNGLHSDGFWYVKKTTTNMTPVLTVNNSDILFNAASSEIQLTGSVSDTDGDNITVKATINGVTKTTTLWVDGTPKPWVLNWSASEIVDGSFTSIEVTATDSQGAADTFIYTGTVFIDRSIPSAPTVQVSTTEWTNQDVVVTITAGADVGSGVTRIEYQINGGPWQTYISPFTINEGGETIIKAKAIDLVGNKSSEASNTVKIMKSRPTTPVITPNVIGWTNSDVVLNFSGGSSTGYTGGTTYGYRIAKDTDPVTGVLPSDYTIGDHAAFTNEGVYEVHVVAFNVLGSYSEIPATYKVMIDKTKPTLLVTPNERSWSEDDVSVNIAATDSLASLKANTLYYKVTSSTATPLAWDLMTDVTAPIVISEEGQWFVHAKVEDNAGNIEEYVSDVFKIQYKPNAPGSLRFTNVGNNSVTIDWDLPVGGVYTDGYIYKLTNKTLGTTKSVSYPTQSITDTGLSGGATYEYELTAENHVGSATSSSFSILTKPDAPSYVQVEKVGRDYSQATITIPALTGADKYRYTVTDVTYGGVQQFEIPDTLLNLTGLRAGAIYHIAVDAENASGYGSSLGVSYLTLPDTAKGFTTVNIYKNKIDLTWENVVSAFNYHLWRSSIPVYSGGDTVFSDMGLDAGTIYDYQLVAENSTGEGEFAYLTDLITLPDAITGLATDLIGSDSASITWNEVRGSDRFEFTLNDGQTSSVTDSTYHTSFTALAAGTEYTVTGVVYNKSGFSDPVTLSFFTLPSVVEETSVVVENIEETSADVSWKPVTGATKYKILVAGRTYEVSGTTVHLTGLTGGKDTQFTLEAGNTSGYGQSISGSFLTKPVAISGILVKSVTDNSITLGWDSNSSDLYFIKVNGNTLTTTSNEILLDGLDSGKLYEITLWSKNSTGESNEVKINVMTKTKPVSDIQITVDEDKATIDFDIEDTVKEVVLIDRDGKEVWRGNEGPIIISPLEAGKSYDYTIVTENNEGTRSEGKDIHFVAVPDQPHGIKASTVTNNAVIFDFSEFTGSNVDQILIYRNGQEIGKVNVPIVDHLFGDSGLNADKKYTYDFVAINKSGKSKPLVIEVKTTAAPKESNNNPRDNTSNIPKEPEDNKSKKPEDNREAEDDNNNQQPSVPNKTSLFEDVSTGSFAVDAINYLTEKDVVKGVTDKMFEPNRDISRIEFAALLVRAVKAGEDATLELTYRDINKKSWYMGELNAAKSNGIAIGFSKTVFKPMDSITREQASKMLGNVILKNGEVTVSDLLTDSFSDTEEVALWASYEVKAMTDIRVIEGYPDGTFKPKNNITRAESAVLVYRMLLQI
ncbi:Endo-1,4-beta-xylanase A precursor [compost metagenome]